MITGSVQINKGYYFIVFNMYNKYGKRKLEQHSTGLEVDNNERKIENLAEKKFALSSINALVQYIEDTQKTSLDHINKITIQ